MDLINSSGVLVLNVEEFSTLAVFKMKNYKNDTFYSTQILNGPITIENTTNETFSNIFIHFE